MVKIECFVRADALSLKNIVGRKPGELKVRSRPTVHDARLTENLDRGCLAHAR